MNKRKIIWLASWYPNRMEPFNGDFIQRHAEAASLYNEIYCIHVTRDNNVTETEHQIHRSGDLTEHIAYFPGNTSLLSKVHNTRKWIRIHKNIIKEYISQFGKPDLVHVHVSMNAGLIARWIKKTYDIPYIISEHSSIYLDEASQDMLPESGTKKALKRILIKQASGVTAVSEHLAKAIRRFSTIADVTVIPNVVNTKIFHSSSLHTGNTPRFVHISTLDRNKHPELIIKAFASLGRPFMLDIFGPVNGDLKALVSQHNLDGKIFFNYERPQAQLVDAIRDADALVLFSEYETFSCVTIEANSCGIPVIASDIPALRELITNEKNGILVNPQNSESLTEKLRWFIDHKHKFNREQIASEAKQKFSYEAIGKEFDALYRSVV